MKLAISTTAKGATSRGIPYGEEIVDPGNAGMPLHQPVAPGAPKLLRQPLGGASRHSLAAELSHAPIRTRQVLRTGITYRRHAARNREAVAPTEPRLAGSPPSVLGHGDPVARAPRVTRTGDDAEHVVVGRSHQQTSEGEVMAVVARGCPGDDLPYSNLGLEEAGTTMAWNRASRVAISSCLTSTDDMADPSNVSISVRGRTVQDGPALKRLLPLARAIVPLPGEAPPGRRWVSITGAPAGTGACQHPQMFLRPDGLLEIAAEALGTLCAPNDPGWP